MPANATPNPAELCERNAALARYFARNYGRHLPHPKDHDGLYSACWLAVWRAASKFDPARGVPFGAYAQWAIRLAAARFVKVERRRGFGGRTARGRPRRDIPVSGEAEFEAGGGNAAGYSARNHASPIHSAPAREEGLRWSDDEWSAVLSPLSGRTRYAVEQRYRYDRSCPDIAAELRLSYEYVYQIVTRGLVTLRTRNPGLIDNLG